MSFAFWSKNDLPDIRLCGDGFNLENDNRSPRSLGLKSKKPIAGLNTSVSMDVDVDNDLQCPICLELYTYPIILPCSHVLCRSPCAEHLFDFNFIRCPVCRDNCYVSGGISSLPRVIALENIIERYKNEQKKGKESPREAPKQTGSQKTRGCTSPDLDKSLALLSNSASALSALASSVKIDTEVKCQNCKNVNARRAKKFCVTCNSHFCVTCLRLSHPNKEPFTAHVFTEPTPTPSGGGGGASKQGKYGSVCSTRAHVLDSYCRLCTQTFCSETEDKSTHDGHDTVPLDEAYKEYKTLVEKNSDRLTNTQSSVVTSLKDMKDSLKDLQQMLTRRRDDINTQCDALLAEIENKRSYFLADVDYEERVHQSHLEENIKTLETVLAASRGLQGYVNDVVTSERAPFLEIASTLNERLIKATLDCKSASSPAVSIDTDSLHYKVVDCRREKVLLREMHYLAPPSTPIIDVTRCSRSESAVVLALCPPSNVHEVVDQYEIHFCSEEQKNIQLEETMIVKNNVEDTCTAKISTNTSGILVLLIENLCRTTTYYFCISAGNASGKSGSSEVVQCTTLGQDENVIPVPQIVDSLCKRFTSSLQIFSTSPVDVSPEQKISHFLLYRQAAHNRLWKCVSMYGREEHRVFGLEPNTDYEFVILAYNLRGECQISNKVVIDTEPSASF